MCHEYWVLDVNVYVVVLDNVYKCKCTIYMFYIGGITKEQPSTSGKQGSTTPGTHEGNVQCHLVLHVLCVVDVCGIGGRYRCGRYSIIQICRPCCLQQSKE